MKRIDTYAKLKGAAIVAPKEGKEGKVRIKFIKGDGQIFTFSKSDLPFPILEKSEYYVEIGEQTEELVSIRPLSGWHLARFSGFSSRDGEVPAPKQNPASQKTTRDGKSYMQEAYQSMIALLKLPEFEDVTLPVFLRYNFTKDKLGNAAVSGGGKHSLLLEAFLDVTGVLDKEFAYKENLLPTIQKIAGRENRTFRVRINNGMAEEFASGDDLDEEDELDDVLEEETLDEDDFSEPVKVSGDDFTKGAHFDDAEDDDD